MPTIAPPVPYTLGPAVGEDDGDFQYTWTVLGVEIPIPVSLAEILDVRLIVRLEIFMVGLCAGLLAAAGVLLVAFYLTVG